MPGHTEDEKKLTRLSNIVVNEISLVDRAANLRRFLVTKRSEKMAGQLVSDGKGGFITKSEDEIKADAEAKAKKESEETKKADDAKVKAEAEAKVKAEAEETKKADDAKKEEDEKKTDAKKAEKADLLITTAEALGKVAEAVEGGADLPANFLSLMTGNLEKIAGSPATDEARAARIDDLNKSLAKLKGKSDDEAEEAKKKFDLKAKIEADKKAKEEAEAKAKTEKATTDERLTKFEETIAKQSEEIRKLSEQPVPGNGRIEKSGSNNTSKDESWPMDLASPDKTSKEVVEKRGVSFYGEDD